MDLEGMPVSEAESSSSTDDSEEEGSLYKASNCAFNMSIFLWLKLLFFIVAFKKKVGKR